MNDALRIVTGCLPPAPTDHLPVLSGIQPAELRRLGATLSLGHRESLDPDHILYNLLSGSSDTRQVRLRSRRPFVPAARNILDNHARLGIHASEWTNYKWNAEYYENARRRLKGIHSRPDTNRTGAEGLSFYYPRLLHCLGQMLAVMSLSQHRVLSSKTVRPRAPCGARCIGHAVSTWSAVCSEAPHSQFGEGARPHLCMDEWNRPTPVRRRLSLTQAARGKLIPTGLAPVSGTKARSLEAFSQYSAFHL